LLLSACGSGPRLSRLADDAVIVAFGDSLTYGFGASADFSYPAELSRLTGREVVNAGINGETTGQGRLRLANSLERHRPALLILCMGGNDFLLHHSADEIEANLRAMIREAKRSNVEVLLLGVPRPGLLLRADPLYESLAESEQLPLEEKALPRILSKRQLKSDTIHPNAEGYAELAQRIQQALQKHGALK
jgi:lysophospholipase L1-like esterase